MKVWTDRPARTLIALKSSSFSPITNNNTQTLKINYSNITQTLHHQSPHQQPTTMQFSKIITSILLFSLSSVAVAAPSPNPLEGRIAELERRTGKMVACAGWTCAFGGNEACQVKMRAEDVPRGFDIADDLFSALPRDMLVDTLPVMSESTSVFLSRWIADRHYSRVCTCISA
jgi:hypothetical protein